MAGLSLGISATFPIELYAQIEKYATDHGYTDKNGPIRGTAVTVLVAQALNFNMPKPASKTESDADRKARETAATKVKQAQAKVALAELTGRNREEATKALAEAQANLANLGTSNGTAPEAPAQPEAPEAQPVAAGGRAR